MRYSGGYSPGDVGNMGAIGFAEDDTPTGIEFFGPTFTREQAAASPNLSTGTMSTIQAQNALMVLGFDIGPSGADGIKGGATTAAIKSFQISVGLSPDGIVGPATSQSLRDRLASNARTTSIIDLDISPVSPTPGAAAPPPAPLVLGPDNIRQKPAVAPPELPSISAPSRGVPLVLAAGIAIAVFAVGAFLISSGKKGKGRGRSRGSVFGGTRAHARRRR